MSTTVNESLLVKRLLNDRSVPSLSEILPHESDTNREDIQALYKEVKAIRETLQDFAGGNFDKEICVRGAVGGYLKTLQANLKHLTWQVEQVAKGDLTQRVDFMGDFSSAFNSMVVQLEQSLTSLKDRESRLLHLTEELRESEERWNLAVQCSRDGIWDYNLATQEFWYSDRLKEILLLGHDEITTPLRFNSRIHPEDVEAAEFLRLLYEREIPLQNFSIDCRIKRYDESYLWVQLKGMPVPGNEPRIIGIISDISLQKENEEALAFRAMHDNLTGLPNRYLLDDRIHQHVAQARRSGSAFILVTLDLDNFKGVNDTWGHGAGDILLKTLGERIKACLRNTDTVARLGGDEFVFIYSCPLNGEELATRQVMERLYTLFKEPVDLGEVEYQINSSMGVAFFPRHSTEIAQLYERADEALYQAKKKGKNTYAIWNGQN